MFRSRSSGKLLQLKMVVILDKELKKYIEKRVKMKMKRVEKRLMKEVLYYLKSN